VAPRRCDLFGGVVVGVLSFVLLVVVAGWRCCWVCAWSMELECLSCYARCSGDLGDGWAEEVLSLRSKISESLADECSEAPAGIGHDKWLPWY
jgi:hypothetical protein